MRNEFQSIIDCNFPNPDSMTFFLAVSGGCDSMVLLDLFINSRYNFRVLHCNYGLRDNAWKETIIVSQQCERIGVPRYLAYFPTRWIEPKGRSIQEVCRDLRYKWFREILMGCTNAVLVTGHHADDNIETFLINLDRGSGLKGLTGMTILHGDIFRPLLKFSNTRIRAYAKEFHVPFREDESNATNDYKRNYLRNEILPQLSSGLPEFTASVNESMEILREADRFIDDQLRSWKASHTQSSGSLTYLSSPDQWPEYLLKRYLIDLGLGKRQIRELFPRILLPGNMYKDDRLRILTTDQGLTIGPVHDDVVDEVIDKLSDIEVENALRISFSVSDLATFRGASISPEDIFVDGDCLKFPLRLRNWQHGDRFRPIGMNGHTKKVSDLLNDHKVDAMQKAGVLVLGNGDGEIIWVVGYRSSDTFKITEKTRQVIRVFREQIT